jgi:hypothetical protein
MYASCQIYAPKKVPPPPPVPTAGVDATKKRKMNISFTLPESEIFQSSNQTCCIRPEEIRSHAVFYENNSGI